MTTRLMVKRLTHLLQAVERCVATGSVKLAYIELRLPENTLSVRYDRVDQTINLLGWEITRNYKINWTDAYNCDDGPSESVLRAGDLVDMLRAVGVDGKSHSNQEYWEYVISALNVRGKVSVRVNP